MDLCQLRKAEMSETRRQLGSLASEVNVSGPEYLRRRVRPEVTHVQRLAAGMWERREETWRPLTRERVAAFIRLYLLALVYEENAYRHREERGTADAALHGSLVRRVIPWVYHHRVWTKDARQWPMSLDQFKALNAYLVDHLPHVSASHQWQGIRMFFDEMEHWPEEQELTEEEAGERNYLEWKNSAENNLNYSNEDD